MDRSTHEGYKHSDDPVYAQHREAIDRVTGSTDAATHRPCRICGRLKPIAEWCPRCGPQDVEAPPDYRRASRLSQRLEPLRLTPPPPSRMLYLAFGVVCALAVLWLVPLVALAARWWLETGRWVLERLGLLLILCALLGCEARIHVESQSGPQPFESPQAAVTLYCADFRGEPIDREELYRRLTATLKPLEGTPAFTLWTREIERLTREQCNPLLDLEGERET